VRRRPLPRPTNFEGEENLTIEEAAMAASCLSALAGSSHEEAYGMPRPWPKERLGSDGLDA
jgi:hypothetical protein